MIRPPRCLDDGLQRAPSPLLCAFKTTEILQLKSKVFKVTSGVVNHKLPFKQIFCSQFSEFGLYKAKMGTRHKLRNG